MLLNILSDYLNQIEQAVLMYSNVYVERYEDEILTLNRATIRIRLRFHQTHLLEINEAIVVADNQLQFLDCRYHFQNEHNHLIFRYDSTPHFPNLSTFPHHKHLPNDVISCHKPEINQVLKEATELLR